MANDDRNIGGPAESTDGEGGTQREGATSELGAASQGGASTPGGDAPVTGGVGGGLGGGTGGTGGFDVGPGTGVGVGAAGVASGSDDDTGGLALGQNAQYNSGEGAGQEMANRLGGHGDDDRATGAGMTGAGSATGDASMMRSEGGGAAGGAGLGGIDAGSPGGMGGTRGAGGTGGTGRPPGGVSPVQIEQATRGDVNEEG